MLPCQEMFGETLGAMIQESFETAIGQPCPCRRGLQCPLVNEDGSPPLVPRLVAPDPVSLPVVRQAS